MKFEVGKSEDPSVATCHYERDPDGQWWTVWVGYFSGDTIGRLKCENSASMEIAYQQGLLDAKYKEMPK
jgi:hypothetical protein